MPQEGVEPAAGERPKTHNLDHAASEIGDVWFTSHKNGSV